jgi:uncharacterized protein
MNGALTFLAACALALGIAAAGVFVQGGLTHLSAGNRHVEVKGLAERIVPADRAVWQFAYSATAPDLAAVQARMTDAQGAVDAFLAEQAVPSDAVTAQPMAVSEYNAAGGAGGYTPLYTATRAYTVRSDEVALIDRLAGASGALAAAGVVLQTQAPAYHFTGLEAIKPEMITQATRSARDAAEQFANDSGARVGAILTARQGYFEILPPEGDGGAWQAAQYRDKRVRVVTTVRFQLVE